MTLNPHRSDRKGRPGPKAPSAFRDPFRDRGAPPEPPAPQPPGGRFRLDRRGFLKAAGFTVGGTLLAGCGREPIRHAIPFLVKPEEITPGRAYWYATLCGACSAGCGVLAKNRNGRPIKLEGNPQHPMSRGRLCAVGQAAVLELYDSRRLPGPRAAGGAREVGWAEVDAAVRSALQAARARGQAVRFLSGTITSPTTNQLIHDLLEGFPDARHVVYDPLSASALLDAHRETLGVRLLPRMHFDRARVIAAFDADFLGTWISPVEFTRGYQAGRTLAGKKTRMSYHVQLESRLSLTGARADRRVAVAPGDLSLVLAHLAERVAARAGVETPWARLEACPVEAPVLRDLAERLWAARGASLVVCGANELPAQRLACYLNHLLGNYGRTADGRPLDLERPSHQKQGCDRDLDVLRADLERGAVGALFVAGVNPVYELADGPAWAAALRKVPLVVSFAERVDETAAHATFLCPDHHPLEAWNDAEAVAGLLTVSQPTLRPLGRTRSLLESLAAWTGRKTTDARALLQDHWRKRLFPRWAPGAGEIEARRGVDPAYRPDFQHFWDDAVHDGFVRVRPEPRLPGTFETGALRAAPRRGPIASGKLALVLYPKVGLREGRHAHNPWLQELPDPISKVTWDNYAALSPAKADELGVRDGDVVRVTVDDGASGGKTTLELPALRQPGLHRGVVAIALGYGRRGTDRFREIGPRWLESRPTVEEGEPVGRNAAVFLTRPGGVLRYAGAQARVEKAGRRHRLASTQRHHALRVPEKLAPRGAPPRPLVQETTLAAYRRDPTAGRHAGHETFSLWNDDHPYPGARWGLAIDLSACTGCSACVISCQAENNVPVVGKDEVARSREMHWIRIDRYYTGDGEDVDVVHQPMMCQQCDNAPCETVCPVLATMHSEEGLNQQIYNRCVGTRYCANNCPYKVRRFNWFDYPRQDRRQKMVLNPDVTVRSRGVMEKCTFCVQRIQEAKSEARRRGRKPADGEIEPACAQSCPARAIVFGDLNDPRSAVAARVRDPRHFRVLEELNIRPSVGYLTRVRNRPEPAGGEHHG